MGETSVVTYLRRRLKEQHPGPLTESNPKGLQVPDMFRRWLHRTNRAQEDGTFVSPIQLAVQVISDSIFGYPERPLDLETDATEARAILHRLFHHNHTRVLPEQSFGLHGFLADAASVLLVRGRAFYAVVWTDDGKNIVRMYRLPGETMKAERKRGVIVRYRQSYSFFAAHEAFSRDQSGVIWITDKKSLPGTTFSFTPDEIFYLEWPFDPSGMPGRPPMQEAMKHVPDWKKSCERILLSLKAATYPDLSGWRYVRARNSSYEREERRREEIELKLKRPFHAPWELSDFDYPGISLTEYYRLWQLKEMLKFCGDIRQYLIDEFNSQIVGALMRRNGIDASALYSCSYRWSNQELDVILEQYASGELSYAEATNKMSSHKD